MPCNKNWKKFFNFRVKTSSNMGLSGWAALFCVSKCIWGFGGCSPKDFLKIIQRGIKMMDEVV